MSEKPSAAFQGVQQLPGDVIEELDRFQAEGETIYSLQMSEAEIFDLASGVIPKTIQAMAISCLHWMDQDRRHVEKPTRPKRKKARGEG